MMKLIKKRYDETDRAEFSDEKLLNVSSSEFAQYADFFEKNNLDELVIEEKGTTIKMRRTVMQVQSAVSASGSFFPSESTPVTAAAPLPSTPSAPVPESVQSEPAGDNFVPVTSPLNGSFYSASSPDAPPFVSVGDSISVGQVLCIVEAMKNFNELKAEISGKIVKVLAQNGDAVKEGQSLFMIDPA